MIALTGNEEFVILSKKNTAQSMNTESQILFPSFQTWIKIKYSPHLPTPQIKWVNHSNKTITINTIAKYTDHIVH